MNTVIFICAANICRSPMAMALFRERAAREPGEWRIDSAGIWAQPGYLPAENTRLVLLARGIRLDNYRSKPITLELMKQYNLILTMERNQCEALRLAFPGLAGRVFMVTEMVDGRPQDVVDPIGGPLVDYEDTARELTDIFERGFERIRTLAAGNAPA